MEHKIRVGIAGATGMVGQQYIALLQGHPWFEVTHVVASARSAGKTYAEAVEGRWHMKVDTPSDGGVTSFCNRRYRGNERSLRFHFSALDTDIAREWEEKYAAAGIPVVSNASAHRHTADVPMVIPEVNPDHMTLFRRNVRRADGKKVLLQ